MTILALNAGSTSLKFRAGGADGTVFFQGEAQDLGGPSPSLNIVDASQNVLSHSVPHSLIEAANAVLDFARSQSALTAIGHRFVHGGPLLRAHTLIDDDVEDALRHAGSFAPLHNPPALQVLNRAQAKFRGVPQIACLDTVFHIDMPEIARRIPLPEDRLGVGVQRYGFHGLSCESILRQLSDLPAKIIIAHLGGGASVTAVRNGRSIDTTMGLTPDGGVMMETRSGDLDPGLLIYLLRRGETVDALERLLNTESGIAGVSGHGGDLREVRKSDEPQARLAIDMFAFGVAKAIASMATSLMGIDLLVFTGGIGWHDSATREAILARLSWLGPLNVRVLPAQEEETIIRHAARLTGP